MANCKDVVIEATVPVDWLDHCTAEERECWNNFVFAPKYTSGLSLEQIQCLGGVHVLLTGVEAVRDGTLAYLVEPLRRQSLHHGDPEYDAPECISRDIEYDPSDTNYYCIPEVAELAGIEDRAKARVEEMMKGKHWETVQIAPGISQSKLVDN